MGNELGFECCNQVLKYDVDDLSEDESIELLNKKAKEMDKTVNNKILREKIKINKLKSNKQSSKNSPKGEVNYSPIINNNNNYNDDISSSDNDDDDIQQKQQKQQKQQQQKQEIEELKNMDEIEGIDINQTDKEMQQFFDNLNKKKQIKSTKKRSRKGSKSRNKLRSKKPSQYQSMGELKDELNEIEIKLQQQLHEAAVLKQENMALRQENFVLKSTFSTNTWRANRKIKGSHQIPPTPPIAPYRSKSKSASHDHSPDVRPLSPVTISITTTNYKFQGSIHKVPSIDLSDLATTSTATATTATATKLPQISPLVDPLPPVYSDIFSVAEHVENIENDNNASNGAMVPGYIETKNTPNTPTTESGISPPLNGPKVSPILTFLSQESSLDLEEEEQLLFNNGCNNEQCIDIKSCLSIQRIIKALEWYSVFINDTKSLLNKINKHQYGIYLLSDYQHILNYHLSNNNINDIEAQYDKIANLIKYECDVNHCNGFKRYKSKQTDNTNSEIDVIVDTMDAIHCYFMHLDC